MRAAGAALASLALCGLAACSDPAWRDPATSRGSAALAPEVVAAAASSAAALTPAAKAKFSLAEPLPAPPDWAAGLIGIQLRVAFPAMAKCLGNADAVRARYTGGGGGVMVAGWAWDPASAAAPPRIVLVDDNFTIQGAGTSGLPRPGVPKALPQVTSENVGWQAITSKTAGPIDAWGVLTDNKTVCKLGHLEL